MKTSLIVRAQLLALTAGVVYTCFVLSDYFLCEFQIPRIITEWWDWISVGLFVSGIVALGAVIFEILKGRYFGKFKNWQVYTIFLVASLGLGIPMSNDLMMGSPTFGYCQSLPK